MRIGVPAETRAGEARVAATPETVKKLVAAKHAVVVQSGAGVAASVPDAAYEAVPGLVVDPAPATYEALIARVAGARAEDDEVGAGVVGSLVPRHDAGVESDVPQLVREHRRELVLGVDHDRAALGEPAGHLALAGTDSAGETDLQHARSIPIAQRSQRRWTRVRWSATRSRLVSRYPSLR